MGDAAVQKMMETKKAYANIVLQAAQEAAARIMISERRAFRIQKEAEFAKQEAVGMLLRLKQTLDTKMHEAEVLSSRQKKKIKELEGQLQEAKGMVRELRKELAIVCDELEQTKKREQSRSLNNIRSKSHISKLDTSWSITESCSNSKVGPNSTFDDDTSTLARRKDEHQSQIIRDTALMTSFGDVPYLPSIIKRTKVPPNFKRLSQGIHALIGNKLGGSSCSPNETVGSKGSSIADSMMIDSLAVDKDSRFGGKKVLGELTAKDVGSNHNDPVKPLHGDQKNHVEDANSNGPLYEHLPTWDLARHETTGHCPSKNAGNGISPLEENVKCSKREAQKAIETSQPTETEICNLNPLPGSAQVKENNPILVKPCSFKNTTGNNDKNEANFLTREGVEVVQPLPTSVGMVDRGSDIMPCSSNAGPDNVKSLEGSYPIMSNIIQYTRKRSRQARENSNSSCDREASPEPVCLKRKPSEGGFDLLPNLNNQASGLKSSQKRESQSIARVAHQLLALSDRKWFR